MKYKNIYSFFVSLLLLHCGSGSDFNKTSALQTSLKGWEKTQQIVDRIKSPVFNDLEFKVTDFGAVGNGLIDNNQAINTTIKKCFDNGGGKVVIPAGKFLSNGPVHLLSGVHLYLARDSELIFGTNPSDYTPLVLVRWEGTLCYNYSPLIYACRQKNIAVSGAGKINGQTQGTWALWKRNNNGKNQDEDKKILRQFGNDKTKVDSRVFGNGYLDLDGDGKDDGYGDGRYHYLRPTTVEFFECENVLLDSLTIMNSPFWTVHPVFCKNVIIRNLNIKAGTTNDDGIDPDSCTDVLIENCIVNTNDDAIAVKAGRDQDAWERPPCQNVIIRKCTLTSGVNSFCIGSEMSAGVHNIFVEDCQILMAKRGLNFKCNLDRGGRVDSIYIRDIAMKKIEDEMFIFRMDYHGYRGNNFPTKFNDFFITDIDVKSVGKTGFKIVGVPSEHIKRVYLKDITINEVPRASEIKFADNIIVENVYIAGEKWSL